MTRAKSLAIFICGFAVNLWAAESSIILQQKDQEMKLFVMGEAADTLYSLLLKGVPIETLPNGSYLEGGNIACSKTFGKDNESHSFCAFSMGQDGLTSDETPMFSPSSAATKGNIHIKENVNNGELQLKISGDVSQKLFILLNSSESKQGLKIGKNVLCQKQNGNISCTTMINQRGIADFPEAQLRSPDANINSKYRGLK